MLPPRAAGACLTVLGIGVSDVSDRKVPLVPVDDVQARPRSDGSVREVALLFIRLGLIAFGGPAAHVATMRREVVELRRWLSEQEFLDLFGAANMIPGP